MMTGTNNRRASDRKYQEKYPTISIRIHREILLQIQGNRTKFINEAIHEKLQQLSTKNANASALKEDLIFMFQFFQKNASNLEITEQEREQIKQILERIR